MSPFLVSFSQSCNLTLENVIKTFPTIVMKKAEEYADIIMRDEREKIVSETPIIYESEKIERIYEFKDGAVVKYEWQNTPDGRTSASGEFNHRFTLTTLPNPNANSFKKGIIKVINYPRS